MVHFHGVVKRYPTGVVALQDVTVAIEPGEFVFLVGPTGSGKSTFLKLIQRVEHPTTGRIVVDGVELGALTAADVPYFRRRLGVVFQEFKLLPHRTVADNVAFALQVTGTDPVEITPRVRWALEVVGLADRAHALPGRLSGGEQQRAGIARAIVNRPRLVLADEPTGNLDPGAAWEIMHLLSEINRRGTTVIVTTHNPTLVDVLRRRVVELQAGRVVRDEHRGLYLPAH
ncbi:MAG: cell division ATP-binding protein FtsE [Armatimonadota bacterium]|nr:cell division ATP-binding protein FtsE [Armatimonadota bacterium]MDR7532843.1 cell division ATP-binding protein FtsE [Armatimonadota bacterium]MDR7535153.1 cell division ATP-binding protein FtsE [Armatimonadota bacterium]